MFFYPLIATGILLLPIYSALMENIFSSGSSIREILVFLFICIACCGISGSLFWFAVCSFLMENRKYTLDEFGVRVKGRKETFYKWEDIHEIIIAAYAASASLQIYETVICVCFQPKPDGFPKRILHSYIYGVTHQKEFLIIDYDPETKEKIDNLYHGSITDIRKMQLGLHDRF